MVDAARHGPQRGGLERHGVAQTCGEGLHACLSGFMRASRAAAKRARVAGRARAQLCSFCSRSLCAACTSPMCPAFTRHCSRACLACSSPAVSSSCALARALRAQSASEPRSMCRASTCVISARTCTCLSSTRQAPSSSIPSLPPSTPLSAVGRKPRARPRDSKSTSSHALSSSAHRLAATTAAKAPSAAGGGSSSSTSAATAHLSWSVANSTESCGVRPISSRGIQSGGESRRSRLCSPCRYARARSFPTLGAAAPDQSAALDSGWPQYRATSSVSSQSTTSPAAANVGCDRSACMSSTIWARLARWPTRRALGGVVLTLTGYAKLRVLRLDARVPRGVLIVLPPREGLYNVVGHGDGVDRGAAAAQCNALLAHHRLAQHVLAAWTAQLVSHARVELDHLVGGR
eukprot:scaffold57601_cov67-Phaeocystis_antarctica.AAC.1